MSGSVITRAGLMGGLLALAGCALPGHPPGQWPEETMGAPQRTVAPAQASAALATPAAPDPVGLEPSEALPPQELAPGECGLFFWTSSLPHNLVVFENETRRRASALHDGATHLMGVPAQRADFVQGDAFRRLYLHQDTGRTFTVTGEVGAATPSGPRIERALLRVRERTGVEVVRPLTGLRVCRGRDGRTGGAIEAPGRVRG